MCSGAHVWPLPCVSDMKLTVLLLAAVAAVALADHRDGKWPLLHTASRFLTVFCNVTTSNKYLLRDSCTLSFYLTGQNLSRNLIHLYSSSVISDLLTVFYYVYLTFQLTCPLILVCIFYKKYILFLLCNSHFVFYLNFGKNIRTPGVFDSNRKWILFPCYSDVNDW